MRLRPRLSASAPAAIRLAPKVSMKAFVTQLSAIGLPPRSAAMRESATAGPVKVKGMVIAARHTDKSTSHLAVEPVVVCNVMDFPI